VCWRLAMGIEPNISSMNKPMHKTK
jgi:hypothetical protein